MSYNQYGGNPYGAPPAYGGYPGGAGAPPGMGAPPGLPTPPPGMSSAPGMAPPGIQQSNAPQANRPSGIPHNFQAPANMPNINFNAPVIRLGTGAAKPSTPTPGGRDEPPSRSGGGRSGLGMERGGDQGRRDQREAVQPVIPPTSEEKLRTIFVHGIPDGVGGDAGMEKILHAVGSLRNWDSAESVMDDHKGSKFGFALYEDPDSLAIAIKLLHETKIEVPVKKQTASSDPPKDDEYEGIDKTELKVAVDESTLKYIESLEENKGDDDTDAPQRLEAARAALQKAVRELFYPSPGAGADADGDVQMGNGESGENVEVVNINLAQDDELADIPAEMRAVVAKEIQSFRDRSIQRDMERLKREEEMEEMERMRNGASRPSRLDSPPPASNIPLGPRGSVPNAPSGPRGQNGDRRGQAFVNGGINNTEYSINKEDEDTDASDGELQRRAESTQKAEDEKRYLEAERKWSNRERSRQAALEREQEREKQDSESFDRRKQEQIDRDKAWDDKREASRKQHPYYRDHAAWVRQRNMDKVDEEARDDADRRAEMGERRREEAENQRARGMADSFLDRQAEEMDRRPTESAPQQPFKLSLGAAAQKAQASKAGAQRRTIAEVEGLLDDEEADTGVKRQLIPIQYDNTTSSSGGKHGTAGMSEEEISAAVRSLAAEIPNEKDGLWAWEVKWEFMDESVIRERLRPFVEKKIVEYLGVQEEMLVEAVEEHLRGHGTAAALVEELEGALDDEAEDLVKKLWRMVIFFTECEKRGLPA